MISTGLNAIFQNPIAEDEIWKSIRPLRSTFAEITECTGGRTKCYIFLQKLLTTILNIV